jgi:hypothetical protein
VRVFESKVVSLANNGSGWILRASRHASQNPRPDSTKTYLMAWDGLLGSHMTAAIAISRWPAAEKKRCTWDRTGHALFPSIWAT